jgi:hypothetical protein
MNSASGAQAWFILASSEFVLGYCWSRPLSRDPLRLLRHFVPESSPFEWDFEFMSRQLWSLFRRALGACPAHRAGPSAGGMLRMRLVKRGLEWIPGF